MKSAKEFFERLQSDEAFANEIEKKAKERAESAMTVASAATLSWDYYDEQKRK